MTDIPALTDALRRSDEYIYPQLRARLRERGVDPATTWLIDLFQDDVNLEFGLILTGDRRVFQLGYRYYSADGPEGEFSEWVDLSHSWRLTPYRQEIDEAFDHLDASR